MYAKLEFNENQIGESHKITIMSDITHDFTFGSVLSVSTNDQVNSSAASLDDIAHKPVIC